MPALIIGGVAALGGALAGSSGSRRAAQIQAQAQQEAARIQAAAAERALQFQQVGAQGALDSTQGQRRTADLGLAALMSGLGLGQFRAGAQTSGGGFTGADGQLYEGPTLTNAQGQTVDAQGNVLRALPSFNLGGPSQQEADAAASPYAGTFLQRFTYNDLTADPSFQFRLDQGRRNLEASLAARGNRMGSQSLADITNYGQQAASQEYQSAFERFERQKQAQFDRLMGAIAPGMQAQQGAAGAIQQSGSQQGQTVSNAGQAVAGNIANAGNAIAGGVMGSTNALVGGLSSLGNLGVTQNFQNQQMQMFNQAFGGGGRFMPSPQGQYNINLLGGGVPRLGGVGGP